MYECQCAFTAHREEKEMAERALKTPRVAVKLLTPPLLSLGMRESH